MKDRYDVQLGVARPVEPVADEPAGETDDPAPPKAVVVVEYRNRGVPFYLVPPLLIVLAAVGIMSYQTMTEPYPLRKPPKLVQAEVPQGSAGVSRQAEAPTVQPVAREAQPSLAPPPRPPVRTTVKRAIEVVETSAEKPAPAAAAVAKPINGPASLFELDTNAGLRPVADAAVTRAANTSEPPLVSPGSGR